MSPRYVAICHLCGEERLLEIPGFAALPRVTSDCRPWPAGGRLVVCSSCAVAQKAVDGALCRELAAVYDGYATASPGAGAEALHFDLCTGGAVPRSEHLLRWVGERHPFPGHGRLLDVGCCTGGLLRAASRLLPGWSLSGFDLEDHHARLMAGLPGFEGHRTGWLEDVPGRYDLVSLTMVLEHLVEPRRALATIRGLLQPEGRVLVETYDAAANPFDLVVADHVTHFDAAGLTGLLGACGLPPEALWTDCVPKELVALARPGPAAAAERAASVEDTRARAASSVAWLCALAELAQGLAREGPPGVYGTAIGGSWTAAVLGGSVAFFVDEDPARQGRDHLGRPVVHPASVPPGVPVLLPFANPIASALRLRLERDWPGRRWVEPPGA